MAAGGTIHGRLGTICTFPDKIAAMTFCGRLEAGGCPAKYESSALENGLEANYCVFVPSALLHRARWIVSQLPISDAELEFLATGMLPDSDGKGEP